MYAHVALPIPLRQTFAYRLPDEWAAQCQPGSLVQVPFGKRNRRGIIVELSSKIDLDESRVRTVTSLVTEEPVVGEHALGLARWMAEYYLCPIGEALSAQLPGGFAVIKTRKNKKPVEELLEAAVPHRLPRPFALTPAQARAVKAITPAVNQPKFEVFLLHGVTGSGKTQVYLEAAQLASNNGGQALFLLPEIALAHGLVQEVRRVFGSRVGVLHSYLTQKERRETWEQARRGALDVVVGARSAVFAQLPNLRLIVVDEEHEPAYKQTEQLRYHGRDVAVVRAQMLGIPCILGSATPALESMANVTRGKFSLLELPERVDNRPLPTVEIIDQTIQEETKSTPSTRARPALLTPRLAGLVEGALSRDEQVLLFLNRRGHSRVVECEICGYTANCPHCDLTLTYHSATGKFLCHYCEHQEAATSSCPKCESPLFKYKGSGTQRIERELEILYPNTRILRLDSDSARKRGATKEILEAFGSGKGEILLGTQLIAKGHDFAGVTLVGVLNSDTALHIPDFRATERTFQLLTQVAGRAGRGDRSGHVILQTHHPEHPALIAASTHDYRSFAEIELLVRKEANYPPWTHLVSFLVSGVQEDRVVAASSMIGEWADLETREGSSTSHSGDSNPEVEVLGPAPQTLMRLRGRYRWHVTLRSAIRSRLHRVARTVLARIENEKLPGGIKVIADVDPMELL